MGSSHFEPHNVPSRYVQISSLVKPNTVCKITFETWADTLSGHDKVCMDIGGIVWTLF